MMIADEWQLPIDAVTLLPHRPPMILVDQLISFQDGAGCVSALVRENDLFVATDGCLEEVAMIELVAQSYATIKGYDDQINKRPVQRGFLVGGRTFKFLRLPHIGETLLIDIVVSGELDSFSVVDGVIKVGDEIIAKGSVKLWLP